MLKKKFDIFLSKDVEFWQRMRDSNCVFLVYMVFLKLLCSQNVTFISVIPLFPTVLFKQIL